MTAAEFNKLSYLEQDRAALAALRQVLSGTAGLPPERAGLTHAMAVMTMRVHDAEKAHDKKGGAA